MTKAYYPKLALSNIKKNGKTYIPYVVTSILTVAMFYIIRSLSLNDGLKSLHGAATAISMLGFGSFVVGLFSAIFLFYTNSFLMKQRKKEFGLYNILGMGKKHICKLLAYETFFIILISLILGFSLGILLDKVMYLLILKILGADVSLGFYISKKAIITTLILFGAIYLMIYLNSIRQIYFSKPIDLLKSKNSGEKEPKAKWFIAILGVICLGAGYYMSVSIKNPVTALFGFLIAVILVIVGTYFVFTAGSIAFLKILRKNKSYYYKTKHFISVSGMIYRMKQNAVGLANICILSTMVLVMISSTSSLWIGLEDVVNDKCPDDICLNINPEFDDDTYNKIKNELEANGYKIKNLNTYSNIFFLAIKDENNFILNSGGIGTSKTLAEQNAIGLSFVTLENYNCFNNSNVTLDDDEILIHSTATSGKYGNKTFKFLDTNYTVKEELDSYPDFITAGSNIVDSYDIVVKDLDVLKSITKAQQEIYTEHASTLETYYGFNINANDLQQIELCNKIEKILNDNPDGVTFYVDCKASVRNNFKASYGGFLFLGLFLGTLFTIATILIIYYKQISEGYDDKHRFEIMQKVGMSHKEVKQTIRSQILTVFFLPLVTAGVHVAFAYPVISKILQLLQLSNTRIFIYCTIGCFAIFSIIYSIIYSLTAKTYYKIVCRE